MRIKQKMFRVKGLPTQACLFVSLMFTELHDQFIFQFLSFNYGLICIMKAFPLFTENKTSCPPPCDLKICSLFPFSLRIKPFVFPFNPQTEFQSPIPGSQSHSIPVPPRITPLLICFLFPQLELHTSLLLSSRAHSGSLYIHIPSPS